MAWPLYLRTMDKTFHHDCFEFNVKYIKKIPLFLYFFPFKAATKQTYTVRNRCLGSITIKIFQLFYYQMSCQGAIKIKPNSCFSSNKEVAYQPCFFWKGLHSSWTSLYMDGTAFGMPKKVLHLGSFKKIEWVCVTLSGLKGRLMWARQM